MLESAQIGGSLHPGFQGNFLHVLTSFMKYFELVLEFAKDILHFLSHEENIPPTLRRRYHQFFQDFSADLVKDGLFHSLKANPRHS